MLTDEQFATAIDCEGCVGINRFKTPYGRVNYSARISLAMNHSAIPTSFHVRFGGSLNRQRNSKGYFESFRWEMVGNRQTGPVLYALLPHLTVKQDQARNVIKFLESRSHSNDFESFWKLAKELNHQNFATDNPREAVLSIPQLATAMDCEGAFGINKFRHPKWVFKYAVRMTLGMQHPSIPKAMCKTFGGSVWAENNPRGNALHRWSLIGNQSSEAVLRALLPHLIVKQDRAQNLLDYLAFYHSTTRHVINRPSEEMERFETFFQKAKALNLPAPATTERIGPVTGCDSLNSEETRRESSEAGIPA